MSHTCIAKTVDQIALEKLTGIQIDNTVPLTPEEANERRKAEDEAAKAQREREKLEAATAYARAREAEYPPVGDQLDAIWKALNTMQLNGTANLPAEADLVLNRILAVKRKYPKPETTKE